VDERLALLTQSPGDEIPWFETFPSAGSLGESTANDNGSGDLCAVGAKRWKTIVGESKDRVK
jgi:hypothetical protein